MTGLIRPIGVVAVSVFGILSICADVPGPSQLSQTAHGASSPASRSIQMRLVQLIPSPTDRIISRPQGFDLDHDSRREFIIRTQDAVDEAAFYESTGDDTFTLAHVLALGSNARLTDAGDIDQDGLSDVVIHLAVAIGGGNAEKFTRIYESQSASTFPTELVWEVAHGQGFGPQGGVITDADHDGSQEIVIEDPNRGALVVFENDGDDVYVETASELLPDGVSFTYGVGSDIDGDGRSEILVGRSISEGSAVLAYESTGDDAYELSWIETMIPWVSVQFVVDAGDLDGDGKAEFLAGGVTPVPLTAYLHVFEAIADNEFEIVSTFQRPSANEGYSDAVVADVDGDGKREIVFSTTWKVTILENVGDNLWSEIWAADWDSDGVGPVVRLGAGDHDGDGKEEIIFRQNGFFGDTGVWEIHPAFQADLDSDDVVDAIDNCPITANPNQEDADGDAVGDLCDNCIYGPNPAQGPAIFGQDVVADDSQTFSWPVAADVVFVKGSLAGVSSYVVDLVDSVALTNDLTDSSVPASGAGFFYLVRPDCAVGSWQTSLRAEPERDLALP